MSADGIRRVPLSSSTAQADTATFLRELLERAERGEFRSVAIVLEPTDRAAGWVSGSKLADGGRGSLVCGLEHLKLQLLREVA